MYFIFVDTWYQRSLLRSSIGPNDAFHARRHDSRLFGHRCGYVTWVANDRQQLYLHCNCIIGILYIIIAYTPLMILSQRSGGTSGIIFKMFDYRIIYMDSYYEFNIRFKISIATCRKRYYKCSRGETERK